MDVWVVSTIVKPIQTNPATGILKALIRDFLHIISSAK
jgi:hypothetical protein